LVAIRLYEK